MVLTDLKILKPQHAYSAKYVLSHNWYSHSKFSTIKSKWPSKYVESVYNALSKKMSIIHVLFILSCHDNHYLIAHAAYLHCGPFDNFYHFKA